MTENDPCDQWPWVWPRTGYRMAAQPSTPLSVEGFDPRDVTPERPVLAVFLPYIRTDWAHWSQGVDWTLESGPDEAPSSLEIEVPYNYSFGSGPSWEHPGDPPEWELGQPWFLNDDGKRCEVCLLPPESERIEAHVENNPPEPYEPDYD